MTNRLTRLAAAGLLALPLLAGGPAFAQGAGPVGQTPSGQQPQNISEQEVQLFQQLQGNVAGRVSIPDAKASLLIQPEGKSWRDFQREELKLIGGIAIFGILAVLAIFFATRGRIKIEGGPAGRTITRFNGLERFAHWLTASCFIVLGLSGLNIAFGRALLLPVIGPEAFTAVSQAGKYAHNYLSFPFTLGVVLMFLLWAKDNIPNKLDIDWLKAGGGLVGKGHAHAHRFNGGQKMIFWSTVLGGGAIAATGYFLMFPFTVTDMAGMQLAHIVHAVLGVLLIAMILAHIYIGSVGMEGAFAAMGSGEVDLNWARAHHDLWVQDMMGTRHEGRGHPVAAE
ncbi:formate dehydrogenase subunit gamma [Aerophototrophica crusticola]|uniref:Formate dehydrogenase subunit gamma n=1 Tax=Aerophototrophica crusticola TaxID=1709002 RepID=A0A858R8Z8_9PROT|nr:formate dehydrogenase subunit gamma [Rhodospirillaceae bacterium B3]